jgi:aryl-alcohol dehydrogenase-like predicted oxidoreductase
MKYRRLGMTEARVSVVGLGTWQFGGEWGRDFAQAEVDAIFDAARETGINLVDTAECYGDHLSERLVGAAIRRDRDKWFVATKFGHGFAGFGARHQLWAVADVRRQLEGSLRALGTDRIDLYQFHSGDNPLFDNQELWSFLRSEVEAGRIGHLGISVANNEDALAHQSARATAVGASVLQVYYNRLERRAEARAFPECRRQDLGVLARVPLASGLLSGKYRQGATFPGNDVRAGRDRAEIDRMLEEVERIRATEAPTGVSMAAWALAWCLKDPVVTAVIPGCKDAGQVRANAAATDLVG